MEIHTNDDLDLKLIADSGQCFRWQEAGDGTYRIISGDKAAYITRTEEAVFQLEGCKEDEAYWHNYLDLDECYRDIRHRIDKDFDPFLWEASRREKGIRILRQEPWEMLISFIISQNKNIPAIQRSIEALCRTTGERHTDIRGEEYFAFPSPEAVYSLKETELRACSLGYRCEYIHLAAGAVLDGSINLNSLKTLDFEEAIGELTKLKGVGIKVASCMVLFGLHQLDAFPQDVWIKRIVQNEYNGEYPFEKYSPYNGVYQQYMFAYYRNHRKE